MNVVDLFKPLALWTAEELRRWMRERHPDDYLLLDIRQTHEYAAGHLPGALSIPLWELPEQLRQLDRTRPIIVYCRYGLRSRAAAALLHGAGCPMIATLEGGYEAWRGRVATGLAAQALAALKTTSVEEFIAAAWYLEDGSEQFYRRMADRCEEVRVAFLFGQLAKAEVQHKKTLAALFEAFQGKPAPQDFARQVLPRPTEEVQVEGGVPLEELLNWALNKPPLACVDLAIAMETNAYDRYLILKRRLVDENLQRIAEVLAGDERRHLEKLLTAYDELSKVEG
ncbi:rhodanese-like domain-containing protein [Geoalkalibacter sp.]|uniref:rhodanese-like domain-containing protein n=1 Tax=Geoalkalibacter sp. TaxID=3041440 RepID=UPI00272E9834|nr:rhodanese-like domain-containing protein [Geoalkalibacter sp.]